MKTKRFITEKFLQFILTILFVTLISFILMRLSPIDPATAYARRSFVASKKGIEKLREQMGLNKPLIIQYLLWLKNAVRLDFGKSLVNSRNVFEEVKKAAYITTNIVLFAAIIQAIGSVIFGFLNYLVRDKLIGRVLNFLCICGISIPPFFIAGLFLDIFAVKFNIVSVASNTGVLRYLPASLCLSVSGIAFFSKLIETSIDKLMKEDSSFYAKCRGLTNAKIIKSYVLPQAIISILPSFMQMMGLCMAGSIIVERIFSLPGLGFIIVDSVLYRDSPMIYAVVLFLAIALAMFNFLADLIQRIMIQKGRI